MTASARSYAAGLSRSPHDQRKERAPRGPAWSPLSRPLQASPAGGRLGLHRCSLGTRAVDARVIQLGAAGDCFSSLRDHGMNAEALDSKQRKWSVFALAGRLRRAIRKDPADLMIANSLRSACVLALVPRGGGARVYYMRDDLSPLRNSRLKLTFMKRVVLRASTPSSPTVIGLRAPSPHASASVEY